MIHEGKDIRPAISFALVRVVDDGVTGAGIVKLGEHATKLVMVESAPYWVTSQGAKIEVDYREGDEVVLRPGRVIGQTTVGKPLVDRPQTHNHPDWPKDIHMIALADIVVTARRVADA